MGAIARRIVDLQVFDQRFPQFMATPAACGNILILAHQVG
jgi:hypothetical protein